MLNEFISKYDGKNVESGGSANALNQCVDLVNRYFEEVLGTPKILGTNAIAFPSKTGDEFQWIVNSGGVKPQEGDVLIWKIGEYGHIAIFVRKIDDNKFVSFDQNYPVGSKCHLQEHDYKNVIGWLRFKKPVSSDITKLEIPKGLYDFLFVENKFSEGNIREGMAIFKSGVVNEFSSRLDGLQKENNNLKQEIIDNKISESQRVSYAVKIATDISNKTIGDQKVVIDDLTSKIKEYQLLSENGIELIFKGIKVLLKGFLRDGEVSKDATKSGDNGSVK